MSTLPTRTHTMNAQRPPELRSRTNSKIQTTAPANTPHWISKGTFGALELITRCRGQTKRPYARLIEKRSYLFVHSLWTKENVVCHRSPQTMPVYLPIFLSLR